MRRLLIALVVIGAAAVPERLGAQQGLDVALVTDRPAYTVGTPVTFTLTATNRAAAPMTLTFSSGQMFDIAVGPPASPAVVWQWSQGRSFIQSITSRTLAPGESLTMSATWNQRNQADSQVPTGVFAATGVLTTAGRPTAGPVLFIIGEEQEFPGPDCSALRSRFPDNTPVELIAGAFNPPDALHSIWVRRGDRWLAWSRLPSAPSDLRAINFGEQVRYCTSAPARWIVPT